MPLGIGDTVDGITSTNPHCSPGLDAAPGRLPRLRRMDGPSIAARGAASMSPTSPASSRPGSGGPKRKRSSGLVGAESSPGSYLDDDHADAADHDKKRQPGVKRACNECRQQKVSHTRRRPPTTTYLGPCMLTGGTHTAALRCRPRALPWLHQV